MKSTDSHINRPEVTAKGTAMAIFFWLLYTLFSAALLSSSEGLPFISALSGMGISSSIMALLMIAAWVLVVQGLYRKSSWLKASAHLISGIIYTFSWYFLYLWIFDLLVGREALGESFTKNLGWILFTTFTVYVIVFAVIHAIESLRQLRLKEKQTAELKELSRQQEISTLKAQLNPHFLFNTLNSINATVTKDPQKTREMIAQLSDMLRYSLDSFEKENVSLREELNFVKTYLDLEQTRLGDRLRVSFEIDESILDLLIPPMIVQPLVENAVKHGIAPVDEVGEILIRIEQQSEEVHFLIEDTGKGIATDSKENKKGIGLKNINEMLTKRFGEDYGLTIAANNPKGISVSFSIPIN